MPDNSAEIARLESLLNTGATSVSSDGETVTLDQTAIRKRLAELRATHDGGTARKNIRTLDLRNAF